MAFLDAALSAANTIASGNPLGLIDDAFALITQRRRRIGILIPHVVVEETHVDEMAVTDHPVETGAAITDHAFLMPQQVEMRVGFSNSKAGTDGFVQLVYEAFLALQRSRKPFTVTTGKRQYKDMLIKTLVVTTDAHSENVLNLVVCLRQIILTKTSSAPLVITGTQGDPASTASTAIGGLKPVGAAGSLPLIAQTDSGAFGKLPDNFVQSVGPTNSNLPIFGQINFGG